MISSSLTSRSHKAGTRVLVSTLVLLLVAASVHAHSWLDCSNWKFNNAAAYTQPDARRWSNSDGVCQGWARRFNIGQRPFGGDDAVQFFRHYVQPGGNAQACRFTDGTTSSSGSNERPGVPRSLSYAPNKDPYGQYTFGTMAKVTAGQTLCWRWPAKNHQAHVNVATNMVYVNWDDVPNRPAGTELNLAQIRTKRVAQMPFGNCPVPGVPSPGDSSGVGSDFKPCGGCFTVPARAPGIYTVQWDWPFKTGDSETYTSCADIEVVAGGTTTDPGTGGTGGGTSGGTTGGTTNVNCVVSAWSAYSACTSDCGSGTQTRTRTVTTQPQGTGTACPSTSESISCNTGSCTNDISAHVVYDDSLHDFQDWSWSTAYSLRSTAVVMSGSTSISFTPRNWEAVFLHYNLPATFAEYRGISFYINGGSSGGQAIRLVIAKSAARSVPILTYNIPKSSIRRNAWTKVSITFANLGFNTGAFDGIWFQAAGDRSQGTVYIDEIYFSHVHATTARLETEGVDECASVACGTGAACLGGACACKAAGFAMDDNGACSIEPSVTNVQVTSVFGDGGLVTSLDVASNSSMSMPMYQISWNTTGAIDAVSITLEKEGSPVLIAIAIRIVNSGTFFWEIPEDIEPGTYYIRVAYSATESGRSSAMTKTGAAEYSPCSDPYCSGHGVCNEDSSFVCDCEYGWTGTTCGTEPSGVTRVRGSIVSKGSYASYKADAAKFTWLFRLDLSAALGLVVDQVEVASVTGQDNDVNSKVEFDVLLGTMFADSPFVTVNSTMADVIDTQLEKSDSSLNRGIHVFASTDSTQQLGGASPARSASFSSATLTAAILLVASLTRFASSSSS